jgi:hypothetical protein
MVTVLLLILLTHMLVREAAIRTAGVLQPLRSYGHEH